jgi:TolB-like protein
MYPRSLFTPKLLCAFLLLLPSLAQAQQIEQAVEDLTTQIVETLQSQGKTKIAVLELTDLSGSSIPLGRLIAEELVSQLFAQGDNRFQLVERSKLEEVLGEQRLGVSGLLEKQNLETFGRVLGVEAILTGTIAVLEDRVRINTRLIGVPSAQLAATASTFMGKLGVPESYLQPDSSLSSTSPEQNSRQVSNGDTDQVGPTASQELQGVTLDLLRCNQATRLIACDFVVTNNGVDRDFWVAITWNDRTLLYDQRGHVFPVSRIQLADVTATNGGAKIFLITEIPTKMTISFEGVPSAIEFVKILQVTTSVGTVHFRDIRFINQ